jgi:hypothetical protein
MTPIQALKFIGRSEPCPHDPVVFESGDITSWMRCDDCGDNVSTFRLYARQEEAKKFSLALEVLSKAIPNTNAPVRLQDVLVPANDSFDALNEFVHHPDVQFEELQSALLGMSRR